MKNLFRLMVFVVLAASVGTISAQTSECYNYSKTDTSINGILRRKKIKNDTIWVLQLSEKACFVSDPADTINTPESGLTDLQLVLSEEEYRKYKPLLNKPVVATGEFFRWHTAHHFTRVLLDIVQLEARR